MGDSSHLITPLSGVLESLLHSGRLAFRPEHGRHTQPIVYLCCWAFSSLEEPGLFPGNTRISWARRGLVQRFSCVLVLLFIQAELEVLPPAHSSGQLPVVLWKISALGSRFTFLMEFVQSALPWTLLNHRLYSFQP